MRVAGCPSPKYFTTFHDRWKDEIFLYREQLANLWGQAPLTKEVRSRGLATTRNILYRLTIWLVYSPGLSGSPSQTRPSNRIQNVWRALRKKSLVGRVFSTIVSIQLLLDLLLTANSLLWGIGHLNTKATKTRV